MRIPSIWLLLITIFLLAVFIRFLYFPNDIYFAFDQARDAFATLDILKGDFKIIGPPSAASVNLFPGPLAYYLYAPAYWLFDINPEALSAFLRIYNALGIFLIFLIGLNLFNKQIGLITALLFAISFEQSQYSLFLSHQALAVVTVLLFYLGLVLVVFKNNPKGLLIASLGLGLSIQFHYSYVLLIPVFILLLSIFRKSLNFNVKYYFLAFAVFLTAISSYILAEFKFNFRFSSEILQGGNKVNFHYETMYLITSRFIHDNLFFVLPQIVMLLLILVVIFAYKKHSREIIFLSIWFFGGLIVYALSGTPSYYYGASTSVSLLVLAALIIYEAPRLKPWYLLSTASQQKLFADRFAEKSIHPRLKSWFSAFADKTFYKQIILSVVLLGLIIASNIHLIINSNYQGVNKDFIIQPAMLIPREKEVLDYIYQKAAGEKFAVSAITVPFNVKTTWDYLFNWYGMQKYHYLPVWGHEAAEGFYGTLPVEIDRSKLPQKRFLIIEPIVGIRAQLVDQFIKEENYFSKVVETNKFGTITVEYRERI